ncbi:MAG TPA: GNAT family N-acetyltransferase [Planococcus sp. (in: firmicutes)]|nr:GNAT family N-acetyltransferase [Planococcus sp. (in: firmicutes)]
MIERLNHRQGKMAKEIQRLQKRAYQVEAELIGFDGIPQMNESVLEIQNSGETFIGYFDGALAGFISYKVKGQVVDIHRLAVAPAHFRQGIGRKLLEHLLRDFPGSDFIVSTGTLNEPARKLYEMYGFELQGSFEPALGISCVNYLKTNTLHINDFEK